MQHACTSAERPRTTSGAEQANRTNGATATPLELVWVYPRYPLSPYIPPVDAACVHECGAPTHDERRRASKSHEWCLSDAAGARLGASTLPAEPVYTICRCSMRVRSSAKGPRTTSGAVQSNRTNGATSTPLGPVWVHARYPLRWGLERLSDGARNCKAVGLAPHDVERLWWRAGGLRRRRGSHCGQVCTTRHHLTSAS